MKKAIVLAVLLVLALSATSLAAPTFSGSASMSLTYSQDNTGVWTGASGKPSLSLTLNASDSAYKFTAGMGPSTSKAPVYVMDHGRIMALDPQTGDVLKNDDGTPMAFYLYKWDVSGKYVLVDADGNPLPAGAAPVVNPAALAKNATPVKTVDVVTGFNFTNAQLDLTGNLFTYTFWWNKDLSDFATPLGFVTAGKSAGDNVRLRSTSTDAFRNLTTLSLTTDIGTGAAYFFPSTVVSGITLGGAASVPFGKKLGTDTVVDGYVTAPVGPATVTGEAKTTLNASASPAPKPSYGIKADVNVPMVEGLKVSGNYKNDGGTDTAGGSVSYGTDLYSTSVGMTQHIADKYAEYNASATVKGDKDDDPGSYTAIKTYAVTGSVNYSTQGKPGTTVSASAAAAIPGFETVQVYGGISYATDEDGISDLDVTKPVTGDDAWFAIPGTDKTYPTQADKDNGTPTEKVDLTQLTTITGKVHVALTDKIGVEGVVNSYTGKAYLGGATLADVSALTLVGTTTYKLSDNAKLTCSLGQGTYTKGSDPAVNTNLIAKIGASVNF